MAEARAQADAVVDAVRRGLPIPELARTKRKPPRALEAAHGRALVKWARLEAVHGNRSDLAWLHHIPNGGARSKAAAGKLKAEGTRRGVWDYCLPTPNSQYHGIYIELKEPGERNKKQGGLTDDQVKFGTFVHRKGYATVVAYEWTEAREALVAYLDGKAVPHFWCPEGVTCAT